MQQLKAIEILKECKSYAEIWSVEPLDKGEQKWIDDVYEAIAELESLQKPKCDGCIHWTPGGGCSGNFMIKCSRFPHLVDRYEPKL